METPLATKDVQTATAAALTSHHFETVLVENAADALAKIKELIPAGASVMNGSSRTLDEVGFVDYLKAGQHGWNNLHANILAETDPTKQAQLRRESVLSDFYLGSVHALSQTGEMVIASNTGSQLPHIVYTSQNLILVVGAQKIAPTLDAALKRLEETVIPLEDERMKKVYGYGTLKAKTLILHAENPAMGRKVHVIIVNQALGY